MEYRDATVAVYEAVWLKRILKDLGVPIKDPTPLFDNNTSSIDLFLRIRRGGVHGTTAQLQLEHPSESRMPTQEAILQS